ncbi:hypothetical protein [Sulfurimonas microaerophilic]|uniref:hypothetical protein n=1 Tax=Sulfurimonas microaerophilic TaxID=3058392 RepID=UPI00271500A3|nr:hypothetical protein [Sulfurimonas sp. hsl 1-7]
MKTLATLLIMITLLLSGCGLKQGVETSAQKAYLYFSGDTDDVLVSIDNGEPFEVKEGRENQYSIKPGKHLIEISKDGEIIIKREIYVGDGIAKEIEVR